MDDFLSDFDDRDLGFFLFDFPDYDAQLAAIRGMVRLRKQADVEFDRELKEIEEFAKRANGRANEQAVDEWVDHLHGSVYQDAAHSMAAVGMLAPFFESLFTQGFLGIERRLRERGVKLTPHKRWTLPPKKRWDCHYVSSSKRPNLVAGIFELAKLTDLAPNLPPHLNPTLNALFGYRNENFHNGFEWPPAKRAAFEKRITDKKWNSHWFDRSTSGGEPWIIYMTHDFVAHCLTTIDQVLEGFGAFVRKTH